MESFSETDKGAFDIGLFFIRCADFETKLWLIYAAIQSFWETIWQCVSKVIHIHHNIFSEWKFLWEKSAWEFTSPRVISRIQWFLFTCGLIQLIHSEVTFLQSYLIMVLSCLRHLNGTPSSTNKAPNSWWWLIFSFLNDPIYFLWNSSLSHIALTVLPNTPY